jgi:hypothetical protein
MIEADLVSAGNNGETVNKRGRDEQSRMGAKKGKRKEKDVFIMMTSGRAARHLPGWLLCLPHYTVPRHFSLSFSLRGIHTYYPGS